ncbi:MAG: hypothetical protein ACU0A5_16730 [Salipiger marinus]|uniref:hypothetical protein n=1 Tax=Salipiger marinus TaxID=555512 RepID=UPI0040588846
MNLAPANDPVPPARAVVDDRTLSRFEVVAHSAQTVGSISDSDATLLLLLAAPIARELQQRRAAMSCICDLTDLANVHFLPGS